MNIDLNKFLAATILLAAPLVQASACVITDSNDESTASDGTGNTTSTTSTTGETDTSDPTMTGTGETGTAESGETGTGDSGTVGTEGTGDSGTVGTEGTDTGVDPGDCCTAHEEPGCSNPQIEACVCEADPFCCSDTEGTWDETCVGLVNESGCGVCG